MFTVRLVLFYFVSPLCCVYFRCATCDGAFYEGKDVMVVVSPTHNTCLTDIVLENDKRLFNLREAEIVLWKKLYSLPTLQIAYS